MIGFDAIIKDAIDCLRTVFESSKRENSLLDDRGEGAEFVFSFSKTHNAKFPLEKAERALQKTADQSTAWLSLACLKGLQVQKTISLHI